jgi:acyl carrier protein
MSGKQTARAVAAPGAAAAEIADSLRRYLAQLSDGKLSVEDIEPNGHLFDYGYIDSLSAVTFMAHVEENYGVRLDDLDLVERFTSLEALASHLQEQRG